MAGPRRDAAAKQVQAAARRLGVRATAGAVAADGTVLMTTAEALHLGELRLPWDRVSRASWDPDERVLTVVATPTPGRPSVTTAFEVEDATRLLEMIRIQVTSNILVSQRIEGTGIGGAWVTARRVPGADEVRWSVVFDPGLDPRDPRLRAWADVHVAELRRSTGV